MGLHNNILRRGATYAWRKRLPSSLGGGMIQISLRTNDPLIARRLAVIVNAESVRIFDRMAEVGLSKEEARKLLRAVIEQELHAIELRRAAASDAPESDAWQRERSADWAMGKALMFMSQRGASARDLSEDDIAGLLAEGHTPSEVGAVEACLDMESQAYAHPPGQYGNSRALKAMRRALGRKDVSAMEFMQGRQIWYQGRAAALLTSLKGDRSFDEAMDLASALARGQGDPASDPAPPVAVAPSKEPETDYDPAISALTLRLMEQKRRQGLSGQMITQMTRVFELFAEATGITDIRDLRQAHVSKFVDVLHALPVSYRKSPKDRDKIAERSRQTAAPDPECGQGEGNGPVRNHDRAQSRLSRPASDQGALGRLCQCDADRSGLVASAQNHPRPRRPPGLHGGGCAAPVRASGLAGQ